uniref:G-protein coupled receptors family 1 profile domain-containing protein n=1 Tax=Cyprinus carpio carpio TaxID=630221 RepID=A0A8C1BLZ9_CYPCA
MAGNLSNLTFTFNLKIAKLDIHPKAIYPVFLAGALIYVFSVVCNGIILGLIITQRSLHKPMFYIMFSLPLTDLIGITVGLPRVLVDILTETNDVYYPTCVLQAFLLHMYACSIPFLLAAMSVDRYIAICKPLRYNSIMTPCKICGIIVLAWGLDFALILVLFSLQSRMVKCKSFITNVYCDNASLLLLSCGGDLTVNNVYGLFITAFIQISTLFLVAPLFIIVLSYMGIVFALSKITTWEARLKALKTCVSHLLLVVSFFLPVICIYIASLITSLTPNARVISGSLSLSLPPMLNPIIYVLNTAEIRVLIQKLLKNRIVSIRKNISKRR